MKLHKIELTGYCAKSPEGPALYLGTAGSYGNEQLAVTLGKGWEGLTVTATFQPAGVTVLVPADGTLDVPWEATETALDAAKGRIVFEGVADGRVLISTDIPYAVGSHSNTEGSNSQPPTPSEWEQFVDEVKGDANRAEQAAKDAEAALQDVKDTGAQAVTDIGAAKNSALDAIAKAGEEAAGSITADVQAAKDAAAAAAQSAKDAAAELPKVQQAGQTALDDIATERENSLTDLEDEGNKQQSAVAGAGASALEAIQKAGQSVTGQITQTGATQVGAVQSAGTTQVGLVNSAGQQQAENIAQAGSQQVQAVQTAGTAAVGAVNDARDNALDALEEVAAHTPVPNPDTGKWQVWDAETGQYEDTTVSAEGPQGPQGNPGPAGQDGAPGVTPQLTIGTVTTLDPDEDATVTITGTAEAPVLNFGIPKGEPGGGMTDEDLDALYASLLDGSNTTTLFQSWWPQTNKNAATKYQRLERWFSLLGNAWQGKTYTVRFYNPDVSGDYNGTPMDDLADGREAAPLVTDASEPVEDWAENDPMTWYIRGNALSLADGTMNILALEGEDGFGLTGETAPVYCFALSTAVWERKDENYLYKSWHTKPGGDYLPMAESVAPDGSYRPMTWHPAFYGGARADGGITSGAGKLPMPWTSASATLPLVRQVSAYEGEWTDCDQQYALAQWQLRHWALSNSGKAEGCTSYNYQYKLAAGETGVKRLLVTTAQGANFLAGSCVCLGNQGDNATNDRNQTYNYDIFNAAKILSVETVEVGGQQYRALNLDLEDAIDTTTAMLVSTMSWPSGTTEALQGHSDGCIGNLTNGKYPYRVAGIEMQIGLYCESLDPLWQVSIVEGKWRYDVYSVRDAAKQATSITSDYEQTGSFDLADDTEYKWHYIKELNALTSETMEPVAVGGSSSTYLRAAFSSPGGAGVLRCPWRGGSLDVGGISGLPCAYGDSALGSSYWFGGPRLAGAGKTRGVWGGNEE